LKIKELKTMTDITPSPYQKLDDYDKTQIIASLLRKWRRAKELGDAKVIQALREKYTMQIISLLPEYSDQGILSRWIDSYVTALHNDLVNKVQIIPDIFQPKYSLPAKFWDKIDPDVKEKIAIYLENDRLYTPKQIKTMFPYLK
jgi:plasmid replication initiation protein